MTAGRNSLAERVEVYALAAEGRHRAAFEARYALSADQIGAIGSVSVALQEHGDRWLGGAFARAALEGADAASVILSRFLTRSA